MACKPTTTDPSLPLPPPYAPLDPAKQEIRLLDQVIWPLGNDSDTIECTLTKALLQPPENTVYAALSCVWGDENVTETILVNGHPMSVTINLSEFLRELRRRRRQQEPQDACTPIVPLWADAVCMNQQDVLERNSQVKPMKTIYASCTTVLLWLDAPSPGMQLAIETSVSFATEIKAQEDAILWTG